MALKLRRPPGWLVTGIVLSLWLAWLSHASWQASQDIEVLPYSAFEERLRDGQVAQVTVSDGRMLGELKVADAQGRRHIMAETVDPALAERLSRFGVSFQQVHESTLLRDLLSWVVPVLLLMGFWTLVTRRAGGLGGGAGLLGVGHSKARLYNMERNTGVRFADVAGVDEAKAELQELVEFLKDPVRHGRLGARVPKGVLLVGPTGTGKTLLARAVAGEAGVAFLSISGSEFIELFVGVGAARVRDLFEQARANAPAIIFIDELDALGKARSALPVAGGHEEREQTLNQLLVELDGFDPSVGVVLLAATNRPEILDPALLRSGRFDRQVLVDRPDRPGRLAILRVHARKIRLAPDIDLDQVAAITVGLAGADLANVVNEAALTATRRGAEAVGLADFTVAIERLVAGIEKKSRLVTAREREWVATHELGHALVALLLPSTDRVHKVSIVPRGMAALGYTLQRPSDDRHLMRRSELMDRLAVLLGGRAAEIMVYGEPSTGAADDLAKATDLARDMVLRFGMDDKLGPVSLAGTHALLLPVPESFPPGQAAAGARTAQQIDEAVHRLLQDAQARATALLSQHRAALARGVKTLVAQEALDEAQLLALLEPQAAAPSSSPATGDKPAAG
jgi:cell division protease FtsH